MYLWKYDLLTVNYGQQSQYIIFFGRPTYNNCVLITFKSCGEYKNGM